MDWSKLESRPEGLAGRAALLRMNLCRGPVSRWGLSHVAWRPDMSVLDVGCGGGMNLRRLLELCPQGRIVGVDVSVESVRKSRKLNAADSGRCDVLLAGVEQLPYPDRTFDVVTAFDAVPFWTDRPLCFREIFRVLRPGSRLLAVCSQGVIPPERLCRELSEAGFSDTALEISRSGWVCITAKKDQ